MSIAPFSEPSLPAAQRVGAANTMHERALVFRVDGQAVLGVLSEPAQATSLPAVLIVVGGPQYRAGSHRLFVQLARACAAAGHPTLRFDVRGMGDSPGEAREFTELDADIGAAVDALAAQVPTDTPIVLWGLCDGASAALMYLERRADRRVGGLCLLNPWVRSDASQARTQVKHYYTGRLRQRAFWLKLISGRVAWSALGELARSLRTMRRSASAAATAARPTEYQSRMRAGWTRHGGPVLLILSGNDLTAREFVEYTGAHAEWQHLLSSNSTERLTIADADHTFSDPNSKVHLFEATLRWLRALPRN